LISQLKHHQTIVARRRHAGRARPDDLQPDGPMTASVVALGLLLLGGPRGRPARQPADTQRIVFVCEHGTVKSVVAAALFNKLARERGLAAVALSRGTAPDSALPALVRDGLLADGAGPWRARPTRLTAADVAGASLFVSFDQPIDALVDRRVPVRRWDGTPSVMASYRAGRDAILERVRALVAELERARGPASSRY
jgi:arsenate reductase